MDYDLFIYLQGLMVWIFYSTLNAPKSCTIQKMLGQNAQKV